MPDLNATIRERIRQELVRRSWKLTVLASHAGIDYRTLQKLVNGSTGWTIERLEQVAHGFDLPPVELLGGAAASPPQDQLLELARALQHLTPEQVAAFLKIAAASAKRGTSHAEAVDASFRSAR